MTFPNQEYPVLDGIAPSWADIACKISSTGFPLLEMSDIKEIKTGCKLEVGEQRGASGGRVLKSTTGSEKSEASMVLYASGFRRFLRALKENAPKRGNQRVVGAIHFGIQIQFTPPGETDIYEIRIKGCRYLGRDFGASEGNDAIPVDVSLHTKQVVDVIDGEEIALL